MDILWYSELNNIPKDNYVVLRFNGLFGDVLFGMCKLQHVQHIYPDLPWIVIHDYCGRERVKCCSEFFDYWHDKGILKYYFHNERADPGPISSSVITDLLEFGIPKKNIFDCYVFQGKPRIMTYPQVGIDIPPKKNKNKAVILRYSGYHGHFFERNRPYEEWIVIENYLLSLGYDVYLLGIDDTMPLTPAVTDLRGKLSVKEGLDFSKDAGICITVTTFLYIWTQFVCPTAVLSAPGDVHGLNNVWKLNPNMNVFSIDNIDYISDIKDFILKVREYDF